MLALQAPLERIARLVLYGSYATSGSMTVLLPSLIGVVKPLGCLMMTSDSSTSVVAAE